MGLDVYCRWPNMTKDEEEAQYTGFRNAGKAGYLRQSWGSLSAWNKVFKAVFGMQWDEMLYPNWEGDNSGSGPDLSNPDERKRLAENRDRLLAYVQNPTPVPKTVQQYFSAENWEKACEIVANEAQEMIDFINLALSKDGATISFC